MPRILTLLSTITVITLAASGCVPVALGGAAAGGYYVGQDDRKVGTIAEDASITADIKGKYLKDEMVSAIDINIDTYEGVVSLYGHVPTRATADRAVRIAHNTKGVKKVISRLEIR